MIERRFSLVPFPAPNLPDISIQGLITLQDNRVGLRYLVAGQVERIFLPQVSQEPSRKDDLWKMTCFEFFLAINGQPPYWEFNLSPSGDWNIYQMDSYRRVGFREVEKLCPPSFNFEREPSQLSLQAMVDLNPLVSAGQDLEIGITAIIQTLDGIETYWALTHPGPIADFHQRESFTLTLKEEHRLLQSASNT